MSMPLSKGNRQDLITGSRPTYYSGMKKFGTYLAILLRLRVLSGEHANYSQKLSQKVLIFHSIMITLLYLMLLIPLPDILINISKTKYVIIPYAQHQIQS